MVTKDTIRTRTGLDIHSLMLIKNDKIVLEEYYICNDGTEHARNKLHRMYSITKSFTAIAIGLLIDEGKLSLDDKIVNYMEYLTGIASTTDAQLQKTSIRDMLSMRSCHKKTTYKIDLEKNWVKSFFVTPSDKEPGTTFNYETASSQVLCALVEKMTGMDMLDYLKMKLPELKLSAESYIIKDPFGVEMGGTGLMCTVEDLLSFALFIEHLGKAGGKQLISADFIREATSKLVDTSLTAKLPFEGYGYGYYFWQHHNEGFMCYGKDGQFIYFEPKNNAIAITTADTSPVPGGNQVLLDELHRMIEAL